MNALPTPVPAPVPAPGDGAGARPVVSIEHVSIDYLVEPVVHAVRDVSLDLHRGEVLGLAGESGCGKSTLAYALMQLLRPPAQVSAGSVTVRPREGAELDALTLTGEALRTYRWDTVAMVFQGAMNSLNPVHSVRTQLEDVFTTHRPHLDKATRRARCAELLERVGVDPNRLQAYPHELSGGMRQRVMIAMALALDPQVLIMDEPTTALDVVVQREILQQITQLRADLGFAVLFITHDLPLLLEISDRIAVMREGRVVELADAYTLYTAPQHPYTRRLLASFPSLTGERGAFVRTGDPRDDDLDDLDAVGHRPAATPREEGPA